MAIPDLIYTWSPAVYLTTQMRFHPPTIAVDTDHYSRTYSGYHRKVVAEKGCRVMDSPLLDATNQIPDSTKACFRESPKPLNPNGSSRIYLPVGAPGRMVWWSVRIIQLQTR